MLLEDVCGDFVQDVGGGPFVGGAVAFTKRDGGEGGGGWFTAAGF